MVWRQTLGAICGCLALASAEAGAQQVRAERVASGLIRPVAIAAAPGRPWLLYVAEQHLGRVRAVDLDTGQVLPGALLDLDDLALGVEQGLLGLAFHPGFAGNGLVFVNFTRAGGDTVLRRYRISAADPGVVDPDDFLDLLVIPQPQPNHNGGWIDFGPDGYLYMAVGDGGSGFDQGTGHTEPGGNAQDLTDNLLGKILRLDVSEGADDFPGDPQRNYAIPPDNPLVGVTGDDEIWAWGLRNPFRCSFDALTGALYCGDVGQRAIEEIDYQPPGQGGVNYGWRLREGTIATPNAAAGGDAPPGALDPIFEYPHGSGPLEGNVVTGGVVYRGPAAALDGLYFFADFSTAHIWSFRFDGSAPAQFDGSNVLEFTDWNEQPGFLPAQGVVGSISTFGSDADGNVYFANLSDGEIFVVGVDSDGDGPVDPRDTCPAYPDPQQLDRDGNGIGDPCECGDQNGDGTVDVWDLIAIHAAMFDRSAATPLCDTNDDGKCTVMDILGANGKIFGGEAFCSRYPAD